MPSVIGPMPTPGRIRCWASTPARAGETAPHRTRTTTNALAILIVRAFSRTGPHTAGPVRHSANMPKEGPAQDLRQGDGLRIVEMRAEGEAERRARGGAQLQANDLKRLSAKMPIG